MPRSSITRAKIEAIIKSVKAGNYYDASAAYAGVPRRTFYDWLKKGRSDIDAGKSTLHSELVEGVEEASGTAEVRHVALIAKAAAKTWQAAAWWLERRYPHKWALRRDSGDGKEVRSALERMMDEARRRANEDT